MKNLLTFIFLFFSFISFQAQTVDPLKSKDAEAQEIWVDSILKSMTIDEKIGQLFMMQAYSNSDKKH